MLSREEPNRESGTQARSSLYLVVKGVWSSQTNTHRLKVSLWLPGTSSEAYSVLWRERHTHTQRRVGERERGGRAGGKRERMKREMSQTTEEHHSLTCSLLLHG